MTDPTRIGKVSFGVLAPFVGPAVLLEFVAVAAGLTACYAVESQRWRSVATTLYILSLAAAVSGILVPRPPGVSRLLVVVLFLFVIALWFFPPTLPAILFSH